MQWVTVGKLLKQIVVNNITNFNHHYKDANICTFFQKIQFTPWIRRITVEHNNNNNITTVFSKVEKTVLTNYRTIPKEDDTRILHNVLGDTFWGNWIQSYRYYSQIKNTLLSKISKHYTGVLINNTYNPDTDIGMLTWRVPLQFISLTTFYLSFPVPNLNVNTSPSSVYNTKQFRWTKTFNPSDYTQHSNNVARETYWKKTFFLEMYINGQFVDRGICLFTESGLARTADIETAVNINFWLAPRSGHDITPTPQGNTFDVVNCVTCVSPHNSNMYFTTQQSHLDISLKITGATPTYWYKFHKYNGQISSQGWTEFDNISSIKLDVDKMKTIDFFVEEYDKGDLTISESFKEVSAFIQEK